MDAIDELIETLRSGSGEPRLAAIRRLADLGAAALPAVTDLLDLARFTRDRQTRVSVFQALVKIDPSSLQVAAWFVEYGTIEQENAEFADTLSHDEAQKVIDQLWAMPDLIQDGEITEQANLIGAIGGAVPTVIPELVTMLTCSPRHPIQIAYALGRITENHPGVVYGNIRHLLSSSDVGVLAAAFKVVGKGKAPPAVFIPDAVAAFVADSERKWVASALGKLAATHPAETIEALHPHISSPARLGGSLVGPFSMGCETSTDLIDEVLRLLNDADSTVQMFAVSVLDDSALGELASRGAEILTRLSGMANEPDQDGREIIAYVVRRLRDQQRLRTPHV